ncbi:helix-turn-helix domain-containing protein [Paenibacillus sp. GD4]|uniref:helix-turn-helix domain-containing protein n=1 Tax=Paenibacillus sp. GD4 TaxID=3068890 RepID=UPI002796CD10|nr:helix-turn-helix domain-containing protein [Paenibacillus sp. GD4]MDQ1912663.1 helix-turn-helix domain-containing protein [Paenibacillus sp. GD4]
MGKARAYRVFVSYLLTYLLILLVPITVMTFLVYNVFVNKLQNEAILGNLNTLDKVRYAMDEQLKRVEDTTYQLMIEDNRLSQYRVSEEHGYKAWGIVREIKKYQKINPFVHEIWLYYHGEASVYSNSSVYSLSLLAGDIYQFADWPKDQLVKDLSTLSKQLVKPPAQDLRGQDRYLRIVVPVLPYENKPYATVVYLIKEKSVEQLLESYSSTGGSTWVLDQDNRVIAGVGSTAELTPDSISALSLAHSGQSSQRITLGKEEQYLFIMQSKQTGWKYVTLLPVTNVLGKVEQAQTIFIYGVAAVLFIGCVIVFLGMRWNYWPIRLLKRETEQMLSAVEPMNELETVRYAISSLSLQNRKLGEQVRSRDAAARKQLVLSLIKGDFTSSEELRLYGEEMGLPIHGTRFRVVIVQLASRIQERDSDLTFHRIEDLLPKQWQGLGTEHVEQNKYIFLMATDEMEDHVFTAIVREFRESLRAVSQDAVTLGAGNESTLPEIPRSYLEANTAIGYRFLQGVDRVIEYKDIPSNRHLEEYPLDDMESLAQSIRTGNGAKVEACLSAMLQFIREKQPPLIVARSLCLDIIRTVNRSWNELELQDQGSSGYPDVFSLEQLDTIDDFEQLIKSMCFDLCAAFRSVQEEGSGSVQRSVEQMKDYIRDHYRECEFTFQSMALHFQMALPNLSQYFKDHTGETLLDYTTGLRMEAAKQLLIEQDWPLKTIAEQVGYYNVSSFIRRFKQLVGMTPGEYRAGAGRD